MSSRRGLGSVPQARRWSWSLRARVVEHSPPLADAAVTFEFGGNSVAATTNESGVATAVVTLNDAPGTYAKTTWVATLSEADSGAGVAGRTSEFFADGTSLGTATTG